MNSVCLSHNLCSSHLLDHPVVNRGILQWLFSWKAVIAIWLNSHMGVQSKKRPSIQAFPLCKYTSISEAFEAKRSQNVAQCNDFWCVQITPKCNFKMYFLLVYFPGESLPLSTGNQITIKFTTVGPETAKGFHFVYQGQFSALSKMYMFIFTLFIQTIENIFGTSWSVFHICIPKHIIIEDICFRTVECIIKVSCSLSLLNGAWNFYSVICFVIFYLFLYYVMLNTSFFKWKQ